MTEQEIREEIENSQLADLLDEWELIKKRKDPEMLKIRSLVKDELKKRLQTKEKKEMVVRVYKNDGTYFCTSMNIGLKEIAMHYFNNFSDVMEIEIVHGGKEENDFIIKQPIKIYKPSAAEIEHFQLTFKIRAVFSIYRKDTKEVEEISCGLI